jgi:uncharacterized membrane protein
MSISIFFTFLIFYLFLSLIYSWCYLRENIAFQLRYSEQKLNHRLHHKIAVIIKTTALSMVFGGISMIQKIYRFFSKKYQACKTWYALVKLAKKITKNLQDDLNDKEKKS